MPPAHFAVSTLKQHRRRELGRRELIALQVWYIQWWIWGLSLALFAFILMTVTWAAETAPWYAAAMTPFLAVLVITENGRSQLHRMEELELACGVSGVLVSVLGTATANMTPALYQQAYLPLWIVVLAAATVAAAVEFTLSIKKMGELQWT